jgi:hypothetical protein
MSTNVLIKEMRIAELSVAPSSKTFVIPLSLVKKFMSNNSTHSSEESENESKLDVLAICLWFGLEPSIRKVNLVTDNDQGPHPRDGLNKGIGIQWKPESLVVSPSCLDFLG